MLWVVRVLWVWVLVLALPVQGFAVAAALHCQPAPVGHVHHHDAGAQVPVEAEVEAAGAHAHHAAGGSTAAGDAATGDHHCSVCAACCSALALPATVARLTPQVIEPTFSHAALPALPSFVPAGLDRPPRTRFA